MWVIPTLASVSRPEARDAGAVVGKDLCDGDSVVMKKVCARKAEQVGDAGRSQTAEHADHDDPAFGPRRFDAG